MKNKVLITVFTPTYNRKHLLKRVYDSLVKQGNFSLFEWLIVDDGSSDDTVEFINKTVENEKRFKIRIYKQEHGGKHRAINTAIDLAHGEFLFILDSDDYLAECAILNVSKWISGIKNRNEIVAVSGMKILSDGELIGGRPVVKENSYIDASNLERNKFGLYGDKAEIYRISVLKENKFPEWENEYFLTEAVCWNQIAMKGGIVRWYNTPICICEYRDDGLTRKGSNARKGHISNYKGFSYYVKQSYEAYTKYEFIPLFWEYHMTSMQKGVKLKNFAKNIGFSCFKYAVFLIVLVPFIGAARKLGAFCRRE